MCLTSDVCPSIAYIGPNSRAERPRKTKIGPEVAHVTRDSDTTFKVKGQLARGGSILWRPPAQLVFCLCSVCWLTYLAQGWAQGSFVEAEAEVEARRSSQRRGKAVMSLTEARQGRGRGRELEAEARQTKFEARPRRGDP